MSNSISRYEDLERTDVLPQLALTDTGDAIGHDSSARTLDNESLAQQSTTSLTAVTSANIQSLPMKPLPIELEVGGIRGKIADLESKLLETQDDKVDLGRQCHQLELRCRASESRATKAEADNVLQTSELARITQRAVDAEQRLNEQRVRLEAHIADIERQLVDARARGDKRAIKLEQLLAQEAEGAAQTERNAIGLRVELEKLRLELHTAQTAIASLEERAAKQTRAAADISRLYAQQSNQAETFAASMEKAQQQILRLQTAKAESDRGGSILQDKLRVANEDIAQLHTDIAARQHAIDASQRQLEQHDREITELRNRENAHEITIDELRAAKQALETRNAELLANLNTAQEKISQGQAQVGRLDGEIQQHEDRMQQLEAANVKAQAEIEAQDRLLAQEQIRVREANERSALASSEVTALNERLRTQSSGIDALQNELQMRHAEFAESVATIESLKRLSIGFADDKAAYDEKITALQAALQTLAAERAALEMENRSNHAELMQTRARHEEAVQGIVVARETISVREQHSATLEHELRTTANRLHEITARLELASAAVQSQDAALRDRDVKISTLEQKLAEHVAALSAIDQDIERVNAAHPSDAYASLGYSLESMDNPDVTHRIARATTTIGRSHSNDIAIDSTSVSRYHARLLVKPEGVWLVDLQSTNGCGVNGRRASRQILCDGDAVLIGHCRFRFSTAAAVETHALAAKQRDAESALARLSSVGNHSSTLSSRQHH